MANEKLERLRIIDELLSTGQPISFQDCVDKMDPVFNRLSDNYYSSSMDSAYGSIFRQDIRTIREIIKTPANEIDPGMLITEGSKRYTKYRYKVPGFSILPYIGYQYTKADYHNLEKALRILENNLPNDVFEHVEFALRSRIEYDYGNKEKSIDYDENYRLRGRERLPLLYKSINKTTLNITYKTFDNQLETYLLHPYLLKLYNNRWFLFGYRPDVSNNYWCLPLDRIENVQLNNEIEIIPRPDGYNRYFDDIIGVTKGKLLDNDVIDDSALFESISIRVGNIQTWKRLITKPLHNSQHIIRDFADEYGVLGLQVIPNTEFYYRLISIGVGVSILSPDAVSKKMCAILNSLIESYSGKN